MSRSSIRIFSLLALLATSLCAQVATNDLFNRPNSTSLGIDWTEQDGDAKVDNNLLLANSPFTYGWCSHNAYSAPYADTVLRANWAMNGGGGDRIALIAGVNPSNWSGIEVRIADNNGDGTADRIFFNAAVNAGAWYTSPSFVNMTAPMFSGQATVWFSNAGDTVNVELLDPVTLQSQTYSASGILANPPTGTKVGIGYFGNATLDDFRVWNGSHTAPVYTLTTPRSLLPTTLLITDAAPSAHLVVGYSIAAPSPVATPFGILGLSSPIDILIDTTADLAGRLEIPMGALGSITGFTVHTQAIDLSSLLLTNWFTAVVL
jgi:hypothetical protein